jgi:hypothetical protein
MNINELFFFKVFECIRDSNHNEKNCYFYHLSPNYESGPNKNVSKDKRREQISFTSFFKNLKNNLENDDINLSIDTIFEFKNKKNNFELNYYTNKPLFSQYNDYIYNQFDCCKNETEFHYHIFNYKKNICQNYKIFKNCKKKFCYKIHSNNNINDQKDNEKNGINDFKKIINTWIEKNEIKLIEIIEAFNNILMFDNKYLKIQLNEIKQIFEPFLKFYNEYKNSNQNDISNIIKYDNMINTKAQRIMQEINRDLNRDSKALKVYKNTDLFESLKISTNFCYISLSDTIKLGEIVKYIYAFLNSSDGVIIFGAELNSNNNYVIKGINIKQKLRDKFQKWFNTEFLKILIEYEGYLKYQIYDLNNNHNEECVLAIEIKQIKITKFLFNSSKKYYIIKEELLNNNKNLKNKILDENGVLELDTREYINFIRKRFINYYSKKFNLNQKI